ncbi:RNA polymerase sigma-70 factor, ECF subfamily [Cohaesibacter sp. ES.047]|uniref:sigma-70 family RNA polymerase sigma factor n=1 Tax=Cohaesibacter sp. ES.047 TaxID=1798205 RepID=UPI000BB7A22F|nr:sigma-70 family RNA polymerase sigma factor [Cohaesibacter sp. ES.047]SNY94194.1 RNA polymerase sigma-70 factor, ECF subfamily [Cohaesibacter sp. ES.047]
MSGSDNARDLELLRQIASNDRKAIALLYQRHHLRLYRYLLRFVKSEAVAEELVNETFIDVWRAAGKFEGRSQVSSWIISIGRNKAISLLRKKSDAELDDDYATSLEDDSDTPEVTTLKQDKAVLMRICINKLSDEHREAIDLVYYQEKAIKEIAVILSVPENTVKTRVFHARKKLSELLSKSGIDRGWP